MRKENEQQRLWSILASDKQAADELNAVTGVSPVVAELLSQRGIQEPLAAVEFLRPTLLSLSSPFCFRDMEKAVQRLLAAKRQNDKILIYGDYDVDGVTSTALLYKVLIDLGFQASAYIPNRQEEGYGLHKDVVQKALDSGVRVLITVDCGVTAVQEVIFANESGIDVIITDHHESLGELPPALAILNPKLEPELPFREFAGVGVAYKLAQALIEVFNETWQLMHSALSLLDLVALGTIADVVPLVGENRIFVRAGLAQMEQTEHIGLEALLAECGLAGKRLKAGQIAFTAAPRINAAGRMDSARAGLELMLTGNPERARELAKYLTGENQRRQEIEKAILAEIEAQLEGSKARVIVLSAPHWHVGVIGIVASRIAERYYRPVFLMAEEGLEAKGSARGIAGYHVLENIDACQELFTKYGGHRQAAGFSLLTENIGTLRERLNEAAAALPEELFRETVSADLEVRLDMLDQQLYQELEMMAPFGFGNRAPCLAARALPVYHMRQIGKEGEHLKFGLGKSGEWEALAFRQGHRVEDFSQSSSIDAVFSIELNRYQNQERLQLVLRDLENEAQWRTEEAEGRMAAVQTGSREEIAAAQAADDGGGDDGEAAIIDWRGLTRAQWLAKANESGRRVLICTEERAAGFRVQTLAAFLGQEEQEGEAAAGEADGLGVVIGPALSWNRFQRQYHRLKELGCLQIALAEFNEVSASRLPELCAYVSREQLVEIYRELKALAGRQNPLLFSMTGETEETSRKSTAIKIFEELGIVQYVGGSARVWLHLAAQNKKLSLESSLRYRGAKKQYEEALVLADYFRQTAIEVLAKDIWLKLREVESGR
ncbi:MAG: single-stranded-DNA-specific exonuclease RecJ [Peptococcaceae bacterium]|jgi:single-stranded-DNA-specific exonuclease|nr:single-stranded-DNA-specific exonuclease RecJ [Peptococcaceae bacterium]